MASHRSAARLWGVERPAGDPVDIILGDAKRHIDLDAACVHRPRDRARLTPQRRAGIPCTNIIRTLCDLGAVAPDGVVDAVRVALDRRLASVAALRAAAEQHARPGRAGIPALRAAIDYWEIDRKPADSILELTFTRLCRDHHLPPFSFHELIGRWEVDFRFAGTPLIVECDGWSTHGLDREQFERDRVKDAELTAAGWQVLRLTYRSIVGDAVGTATRLRRALDRWSGTPCPSV